MIFRTPRVQDIMCTTNQLERLMKDIKRRAKVLEIFSWSEAVHKVVYLVLLQRYERKGFTNFREFITKN